MVKGYFETEEVEDKDLKRVDIDEVYEYELPENFKDEEIDEDEAFNSEDEAAFGTHFEKEQSDESEEEDDGVLLSDMLNDDKRKDLVDFITSKKPSGEKKLELHKHQEVSLFGNINEFNQEAGMGLTLSKLLGEEKGSSDLQALARQSGLEKPVASVTTDRAERRVVYGKKKVQIGEYQDLVKANREADTVDFRNVVKESQSSGTLSMKFKASTDLEKNVNDLLKDEGYNGDGVIQKKELEELEKRGASMEEVESRKAELSKMRALMFYSEQKSKRLKKIKSKLYHKIRNKKNGKEEEEKQILEQEEKRAEERMTLKHNNTSKWIKHQLQRGINASDSSRTAVAKQLEKGQELRRKMNNVQDDETSSSDNDTDDESKVQRKLANKTNSLLADIENDGNGINDEKGLLSMKFMQRAKEKQRLEAKQQTLKLLQEIRNDDSDVENSGNENDAPADLKKQRKVTSKDTQKVQTLLGNSMRIQPKSSTTTALPEKVIDKVVDVPLSNDKENPWVQSASSSKSRNRKRKSDNVDAVDMQTAIESVSNIVKRKKSDTADNGLQKQAELVDRAFAFAQDPEQSGETELEKEKNMAASQSVSVKQGKEIARLMGVNGWGSWAGEGTKPTKWQMERKANAEKVVLESTAKILAARKDAKLKHVLISEKRDKKATKFMCAAVPYPFTSRQQYELAMRNPLGSDWNTARSAQKLSQPKIMTRAGTIINPLELTEAKKFTKKLANKSKRKAKF